MSSLPPQAPRTNRTHPAQQTNSDERGDTNHGNGTETRAPSGEVARAQVRAGASGATVVDLHSWVLPANEFAALCDLASSVMAGPLGRDDPRIESISVELTGVLRTLELMPHPPVLSSAVKSSRRANQPPHFSPGQ